MSKWTTSAVLCCAAAAVGVFGAAAHGGINKIDSTPARISTNFSVANVGGVPAVVYVEPGLLGGPDQILALPLSGGTPLTIMGSDFGRRVSGKLASDGVDGGSVYFSEAKDASTDGGVFQIPTASPSSGNIILTVRGGTFTGGPGAVSAERVGKTGQASGKVVFSDLSATGEPVVVARAGTGNVPITVIGQDFAPVGKPAISPGGSVATLGTAQGDATSPPGPAVLVRPGGGSTVLTIRGENFGPMLNGRVYFAGGELEPVLISTMKDTPTGPQPILAMAAKRGYDAYAALATEVLRKEPPVKANPIPGDGLFEVATMAGISPTGTRMGQMNILVRYPLHLSLSKVTIDTPPLDPPTSGNRLPGPSGTPGITEIPLLNFGDAVGSSTITAIDIGDGSALDEYNFVVHLTLSDGSSGFYIYSIPEPAALGLVAPAALLLRRRR